jgi:SAM-dependent methyltransferase
MIGALRRHLRRQQFNPDLSGAFVNPFFLARRELWRGIAAASPALSGPLLDVGCGTKPYRALFATEVYVGLDIDSTRTRELAIADAYYDGGRFPFGNAEFGSVLCNQVLEHVFNPSEFLGELGRVLARGGRLLLTVPFVWDEHEQPYDYARYSSFGLKALLEQHGFRVLQQRKLLANVAVVFQLFNAYLFKTTQSRFGLVNRLVTAFVLAPVSLLGLILGALLPDNPDLFLDQLVVAERL